jgi:hypothetical protein
LPGEPTPVVDLVPPAVEIQGAPPDVLVPSDSCLARPELDTCPVVSSVEYVPPVTAAASGPVEDLQDVPPESGSHNAFLYVPNPIQAYGLYIPQASSGASTAGPEEQYGTCTVETTNVANNNDGGSGAGYHDYVISATFQDCSKYFQYQELGITIQRYRNGAWENLASGFNSSSTRDYIERIVSYNCYHLKSYPYRNDSYGYHTRANRGYYASVRSSTEYHTCPS